MSKTEHIRNDGTTISHKGIVIRITRLRTPKYRGYSTGLLLGWGHRVDNPVKKYLVALGIVTGSGDGEFYTQVGIDNYYYDKSVTPLLESYFKGFGKRGYETLVCDSETQVLNSHKQLKLF